MNQEQTIRIRVASDMGTVKLEGFKITSVVMDDTSVNPSALDIMEAIAAETGGQRFDYHFPRVEESEEVIK